MAAGGFQTQYSARLGKKKKLKSISRKGCDPGPSIWGLSTPNKVTNKHHWNQSRQASASWTIQRGFGIKDKGWGFLTKSLPLAGLLDLTLLRKIISNDKLRTYANKFTMDIASYGLQDWSLLQVNTLSASLKIKISLSDPVDTGERSPTMTRDMMTKGLVSREYQRWMRCLKWVKSYQTF